MKNILLTILIALLTVPVSAQIEESPDKTMVGYWTGAMIRSGNSVQTMTADITQQGDSLVIGVSIPDWVYYPPKTSTIHVDSLNRILFETYYGKATMLLDSAYQEMAGSINEANPSYQFHLKKSLKPFKPVVKELDVDVQNMGANVGGTLYYRPDIEQPMTTAILLHGRGCGTRYWKRGRAMKLAEYGMATFVYDKRGSEASGYPCERATHDQNVADIEAIVSELAAVDQVDADNIGLIGSSAGGWIAPHVTQTSSIPIAFLVNLVGPTTSVKQQQLDGLEAYLKDAGYGSTAIKEAKEYTSLMFTTDDYEAAHTRMQELLVNARETGWDQWLVDDDYADSPDDIKKMWVQRFSYDPAEALMSYANPFLAVFAEKDPVVPYKKQIDRLKELKAKSPSMDVTTKIIPSAYHSLEHGPEVRDLGRDPITNQPAYYFKYDRVAYGAIGYTVDFLRDHGFIE
jgi:pimeloyl-ACP methyl ester carboxylesterase